MGAESVKGTWPWAILHAPIVHMCWQCACLCRVQSDVFVWVEWVQESFDRPLFVTHNWMYIVNRWQFAVIVFFSCTHHAAPSFIIPSFIIINTSRAHSMANSRFDGSDWPDTWTNHSWEGGGHGDDKMAVDFLLLRGRKTRTFPARNSSKEKKRELLRPRTFPGLQYSHYNILVLLCNFSIPFSWLWLKGLLLTYHTLVVS